MSVTAASAANEEAPIEAQHSSPPCRLVPQRLRRRLRGVPALAVACAGLLAPVLGLDAQQTGLLFLFGCLPPAVLNFMVAEQFRQEPAKVASIVLIGNAMSVLFVPVGLVIALP